MGLILTPQQLNLVENVSYKCRILQAKIDLLGDVDPVNLICHTPGSFKLVADNMEDLAGLLDDIGLENLCKQLDIAAEDCTPF